MGFVCRLLGHKLRNSLEIVDDKKDFYEVNWVKVCERCGDVIRK